MKSIKQRFSSFFKRSIRIILIKLLVLMPAAPHMTSLNFTNIEKLIGSNFKKSKDDVAIVLGVMDLDWH